MAGEIFMRVNEVAEELGVSVPYAYTCLYYTIKAGKSTEIYAIFGTFLSE